MRSPALILALLLAATRMWAGVADYYSIEDIPTPPEVDAEIHGLACSPSGKLFVCFHRGEVFSYDPAAKLWKEFARGLHEPLGVVALSDTELVVMQRPELTRLIDSDGDGQADRFDTVTDQFGMTGNYHEFAFGPVVDRNGDFYIALNLASNGASIMPEIRGEFRHYGITREDFYQHWSTMKDKAGRMYSAVPYRGWVLKVDGKTGAVSPFACGFRSPNSLALDASGNLFLADNQGDWLGGSKLFSVKAGGFYGHPASLAWRQDWGKRNPLSVPVAELNKLRTREAVMFPYEVMAKSPSQPLFDATQGKFGPFAGQLFIGEMNTARIARVMLEPVAGELQGACIAFYDNAGLSPGNNRLAFDHDGALWVGHTHLSWAGGKGLQRIRWNGKTPMELLAMELTNDGFRLRFTKALAADAVKSERFAFRRYYYEYHEAYGSKIMDPAPVAVQSIALSTDRLSVTAKLAELKPGYLYELTMHDLAAADGGALVNAQATYTLNHLRDGTAPAPTFGISGGEKPAPGKRP